MKHSKDGLYHNQEHVGTNVASHVATSTVVGICFGTLTFIAALAATGYYCYYKKRHYSNESRKPSNRPDQPLTLRRPTAVKSSGSGPLKKSPSPTCLKSPPGQGSKLGPSMPELKGGSEFKPNDLEKQVRRVSTGTSTEQKNSPGSSTVNLNTTNGFYKYFVENEKDNVSEKLNQQNSSKQSEIIEDVKEGTDVKSQSDLGRINFSLYHDADKNALMVTIINCSDLPSNTKADNNMVATCDPYVKLQLLPDKQHKVKTRVVRKTTNPVYNEDFTFYGISNKELSNTTLHFVILSFDRYSRDDIIGEVVCNLNTIDLVKSEKEISLTKDITPRQLQLFQNKNQNRGELLASLCYQPVSNRLTVVVLKARNLPKVDITGLSDPYVKVYLLYNGQRISKKKTHVKKRTLNPVFNESFVFEVPSNEGLENLSLEFMVLDWDRMTKNEVIGKVELGCNVKGSSSAAVHHWLEVYNSPRRQIAEWHKLKG